MYQHVTGSSVLIFGDLHVSDRVKVGRHKDYAANCFEILRIIKEKVEQERPCAVVFLGDVMGTSERNFRNRELLTVFLQFFMDLKQYTKVFCVRGNHDTGDYPEFQVLSDLRLIETAVSCDGYFDYFGTQEQYESGVPEVRFHLIDYGDERKELQLLKEPTSNVALAHNDFSVAGVTTWYYSKDGYELNTMHNLDGVQMLISGHIHNPSPYMVSTEFASGNTIDLFYPGCPTRPAENYDFCHIVKLKYDEQSGETQYDAEQMPLRNDIFEEGRVADELSDEEIASVEQSEKLQEVLQEMLQFRIATNNLFEQIQAIPEASQDVKDICTHYLQLAQTSGTS